MRTTTLPEIGQRLCGAVFRIVTASREMFVGRIETAKVSATPPTHLMLRASWIVRIKTNGSPEQSRSIGLEPIPESFAGPYNLDFVVQKIVSANEGPIIIGQNEKIEILEAGPTALAIAEFEKQRVQTD